MGRMDNKVVLVTGATSGIGAATATLLAQEGAKVVVSGRRESEGLAVVKTITDAGGTATFVRADVSQEADVKALVAQTVATYGRLDGAFNNAGVEGTFGATPESDEATWEHTININLKGAWLSLKHTNPSNRCVRGRRSGAERFRSRVGWNGERRDLFGEQGAAWMRWRGRSLWKSPRRGCG